MGNSTAQQFRRPFFTNTGSNNKVRDDESISQRIKKDKVLEEGKLKYYAEQAQLTAKVVVLGLESSGKSTMIEQLRIAYGEPYNEDELANALAVIHSNTLEGMKILIQQAKRLKISGRVEQQAELTHVEQLTLTPGQYLTTHTLRAIGKLWADPTIQLVWGTRQEYSINPAVAYFFDRCGQLATPGYLPSSEDILRSYRPTLGVSTKRCEVHGSMFELHDVGHLATNAPNTYAKSLTDAKAVLFVVDLTDICEVCSDGPKKEPKNKMLEAVDLFGRVCNHPHVRTAAIVLVFNKVDVFERLLGRVRLRDVPAFSDYRGPDRGVNDSIKYLLALFMREILPAPVLRGGRECSRVHHFVTNALDTETVMTTLLRVRDVVEDRTAAEESLVSITGLGLDFANGGDSSPLGPAGRGSDERRSLYDERRTSTSFAESGLMMSGEPMNLFRTPQSHEDLTGFSSLQSSSRK